MVNIVESIFSSAHYIFFKVISPHFKAKTFKPLMDVLYVYFEQIATHFDIINEYYIKLYDDIIKNEIKLARIDQSDHVLVIGSGSLPMTPILITKNTKAKIHTVDKDKKAVRNAQRYLKRFHLSKRITVSYNDASQLNMTDFDVIFVLYGIRGLEKVFSMIKKTASPSVRVVYRIPPDALDNLSMELVCPSSFIIQKKVITYSIGGVISLLLQKKRLTSINEIAESKN
ncbi:MAG: nicotianamine synthase family protein [Thermoplasmatota archaeon]